MDELAHAAGADPLMIRLSLIEHLPSRRMLESVAEMSNWGSDLPEGHARGVAYSLFKRVPTAQVVEISHSDAAIKVLKAFAAVDVGIPLDRRNIEAQLQAALTFGLSAAILSEIAVLTSTDVLCRSCQHDFSPSSVPRTTFVPRMSLGTRLGVNWMR